METIPFMIPSTSAVSEPSLKLASHTEMIFCRSSSSPASLLSSEMSAPRDSSLRCCSTFQRRSDPIHRKDSFETEQPCPWS